MKTPDFTLGHGLYLKKSKPFDLEDVKQSIKDGKREFNHDLYNNEIENLNKQEITISLIASLNKKILRALYISINEENEEQINPKIQEHILKQFEVTDISELGTTFEDVFNTIKSEIQNHNDQDKFAFWAQNTMLGLEKVNVPAQLKLKNIDEILVNKAQSLRNDLLKINEEATLMIEVVFEVYKENETRLRYIEHLSNLLQKKTQELIAKKPKLKGKDRVYKLTDEDRELEKKEKTTLLEKELESLSDRAIESFGPDFCKNKNDFFQNITAKINETQNEKYKKVLTNTKEHYQNLDERLITLKNNLAPIPEREEDTSRPRFKETDEFKNLNTAQLIAIDWMTSEDRTTTIGEKVGKSGILGDEMGFGKTLTGIGTLLTLNSKENFIICPNSIIENWASNLQEKTNIPEENIITIKNEKDFDKDNKEINPNFPVYYILNNEKLTAKKYYNKLNGIINQEENNEARTVMVDEAHNYKTSTGTVSKMSSALLSLQAENRFLLTGTPIVNTGKDLYNYYSYINPEKYPYKGEDGKMSPEQKNFNKKVKSFDGIIETYEELNKNMMRRKNSDYHPILKEIREKVKRKEIKARLPKLAKQAYLEIIRTFRRNYQNSSSGEKLTPTEYMRTFHLLKNTEIDPILLVEEDKNNVIRRQLDSEQLEEIFGTHDILEITKMLEEEQLEANTKISQVIQIISKEIPDNEKVVIYVSSPYVVERLSKLLTQAGQKNVFIKGGIDGIKRGKIADEFNNSNDCKVFIMNGVGSEGINLYNATHLINIDYPMTSSEMYQIEGRLIRQGQENNVSIYNFLTELPEELESMDKNITITSIDTHIKKKILPIKEKLVDFFLEGLITEKELEKLREIVDEKRKYLIKLAETKMKGI